MTGVQTCALPIYALSAQAVPSTAADRRFRPTATGGAAPILLGRAVVSLRALAPRTQSPRVTQADAALVGAVAVVADGAVGLSCSLALALALEGDGDREGVLEAHRFDDEGFAFLLGAAAGAGLHAKGDLGGAGSEVKGDR